MTARQAFALASPIAAELETAERLTLLTSGEDIDADGRARMWEFFFDLPELRACAAIEVLCPVEDAFPPDDVGRIEVRVVPFASPGGIMDQLLQAGRVSPRFLDDRWDDELRRRPPLPVPFRDSPNAVRDLVPPDVEWIDGSTLLSLRGHVLHDGAPVWEADSRNQVWRAPFA